MDAEAFEAVMAQIQEANKDGMDFRGKKYTMVAPRVEIFRRNFGGVYGIETEIVHLGTVRGEPVVVKAYVRDDKGFTVGTGHAWEVIGEGHVNKTSALENAETSAIGRALASMGFHGGEYASGNELRDKPENPTTEALMDAWEQGIMDMLPDDPSAETVADAYADAMEAESTAYKSARGVENYMRKHEKHLLFIKEHAPERYGPVRSSAWAHMQKLNEGKAA